LLQANLLQLYLWHLESAMHGNDINGDGLCNWSGFWKQRWKAVTLTSAWDIMSFQWSLGLMRAPLDLWSIIIGLASSVSTARSELLPPVLETRGLVVGEGRNTASNWVAVLFPHITMNKSSDDHGSSTDLFFGFKTHCSAPHNWNGQSRCFVCCVLPSDSNATNLIAHQNFLPLARSLRNNSKWTGLPLLQIHLRWN
jgi:hypothetical protein